MAGHSRSAAVPVLPARPTASSWTKKPGAASQSVSVRSSAPSPHSGATGCTSPLLNRHGAGHCAWTTQTPILPKSKSVTRWRPRRLPASSIRRRLYQARRSPPRPLAGSSPNLAWPLRGRPTTSCPRPSSLRQSPPRERDSSWGKSASAVHPIHLLTSSTATDNLRIHRLEMHSLWIGSLRPVEMEPCPPTASRRSHQPPVSSAGVCAPAASSWACPRRSWPSAPPCTGRTSARSNAANATSASTTSSASPTPSTPTLVGW